MARELVDPRCAVRTLMILTAAAALSGCNRYEMFRLGGYAQESFSNDADILFVIDNSLSMTDEATALATNIGVFVDRLTNPEYTGITTEGLDDATDNYIEYVQNRGRFIDFQLAITTTDVEATYGDLYGSPRIIDQEDPDVAAAFEANVLCTATCFNESEVPGDASYSCGDPLDGREVSYEYLNCVCGEGVWEDNCGSGTEEHLEALFMSMCRASSDPPEDCYELNQFTAQDELSNEGLLRPNSTLIPVIVTDEGDGSRRMTTSDDTPDEYEALYEQFDARMAFAVIGPRIDRCNSGGAQGWGVDRFQYFVDETDGRWFDITALGVPEDEVIDPDTGFACWDTNGNDEADATEDLNGDGKVDGGDCCTISDFAAALEELGDLLNSLATAFPLDSVPAVETIRVFVDGEEVPASVETVAEDLTVEYSDGWSYQPSENAIEFHGNAVPDYNADVEIYYLPLEGMPRELPF